MINDECWNDECWKKYYFLLSELQSIEAALRYADAQPDKASYDESTEIILAHLITMKNTIDYLVSKVIT
ncbi:hypothetical protein [Ktedonobacter racemifer]|uniref:Uncharacterized protein n=1 Tax=Ktedonobacter racemifer DSM 44963 TaxID=485913 RepID=D6TPY0_KTERA|nr:hypothetical protein [Ktedonobacter racemifer]EFH87565.1 hypothetical protein Krac_8901 [Ktedonobacter racemifer DSM 44963]